MISPKQIREHDKKIKESVDTWFERDALRISALYSGSGRDVVRAHLKSLGMGDKHNMDPIQVGVIARLVEMLSVLYSSPANRTLIVGGEQIAHDDPIAAEFRRLARGMQLNQIWAYADRMRNLLRQCVVMFAESKRGTVAARVFEPFNVYRIPSLVGGDTLDEDEAIALKVYHSPREEDCLYQLWVRFEKSWRCWITRDSGEKFGPQPYGDSGETPYGLLPLVLVTDEALFGRAWLPIPQSRLSLALNIDAVANDVQLLVKHEGHTQMVITSDDPAGVPDEIGADKILKVPTGTEVERIATSPKIDEAGRTIDRKLAMLALSESLPVDAFSDRAQLRTGAALRVAERDLERRRSRHAELAATFEQDAYRRYSAIARAYGYANLPEDAEMVVTFVRPYLPSDALEAQKLALSELAIGVKSKIEYVAEARNVSNDEARVILDRVEAENEEYPITSVSEIVGEAVMTKSTTTTGPAGAGVSQSFNPDLPNSSHGGSLIDRVLTDRTA